MFSDTRRNVVLVQVNFQYGKNVFVPYSVGSIQAFARTNSLVNENFKFAPLLFRRDAPEKVVSEMKQPTVVGFSCYLWNWEYNKCLAQAVRAKYPETLIVFGGTHVPDASEGFFIEHPYVDILVHQEGEFSFTDILAESLSMNPDYTQIPGLSVRVEGNETLKTSPRPRISDITQLPSPYLEGLFDFMLDGDYVLNVSQETTRGCPYTCTFCDWGGNTYSKVYAAAEERLHAEFEWFGRNRVEYVFNCDANYGIMPRDVELTKKMIEVRSRHEGFPKRFRMCTAKNSNDRIFEIVQLLDGAGMNKGATLSFQSMDPHTLEIVRRSNIKMDKFSDLMDRYKAADIATYTELIMGMPGETYDSSKKGIDLLIDGQDDAVNIYVYPCTMLPNSEMSTPDYVKKHGIESVRMPILLAHSTPEPESLSEYTNIVISTSTMSEEDWQRTYMFYWAVQSFHCLGLLQQIAIVLHKQFGVLYSDFYEKLVEYFTANNQTLIGGEILRTRNIVKRAMSGGRIDRVMPEFGDIYWPLEEASFLSFVTEKERFFGEIREFLGFLANNLNLSQTSPLWDDLVAYQSSIVIDPYSSERSIQLKYNLPDYFDHLREVTELKASPVQVMVRGTVNYNGDLEEYAREVVWYGRKGGSFHHTDVVLEVL